MVSQQNEIIPLKQSVIRCSSKHSEAGSHSVEISKLGRVFLGLRAVVCPIFLSPCLIVRYTGWSFILGHPVYSDLDPGPL